MKICRKCGTTMPDEMKYCVRCGAVLDGAAITSSEEKKDKQENTRLTIGIASAASIVIVGLLFLCIFVFGNPPKYYLASGNKEAEKSQDTGKKDTAKEGKNANAGQLSFSADTYEVEINKDIDMTKYLQCSGMEMTEVNWNSDSDKMYVGSDGHVSVHENGIECTLTAVSKSDDEVKAQCHLKTRTEAEDLAYQVNAINGAEMKDEVVGDGIIRVAYDTEDSQMIDLSVQEYEPGKRSDDYSWDKTLFYTLEDIDLTSNSDGRINSYLLEKKQFINRESGNKMEYEIYQNPDTNVINKIVSIEYLEKKLAIMEFYFTDEGEVNFIYSYDDVNYTPSYATPNRDGERFLFSHDTLATYRVVKDGKMTNYCYGSAEKKRLKESYKGIKVYSKCNKDTQQKYDEKERYMLNLAYITMDKITQEEGLSTISGYVYDSSGNGMKDTEVKLASQDYQCDLYSMLTDENGYYEIRIPTRELNYSLNFNKTDCIEEQICEVKADLDEINLVQEIVYLSAEDSTEYECGLEFFDALNKSEDGYGMASLDGVDVEIRRGVNNRTGDVVLQLHMDSSYETVSLLPGMYTVHSSKQGYMDCYSTLFVCSDWDNYLDVYETPALNEDEIRIVLTWNDDPGDLDSHLFTPSTSGLEEDYHICYYNMEDTNGNTSLDVDDTDGYGPETTTINHMQKGLYKFYVCDYTDCSDDAEESERMSNSEATVRVYGSQGLIETFNVPVRRKGVIWEVFEIRDGTLIPNQRYYDSIGDKTWWQSDKY